MVTTAPALLVLGASFLVSLITVSLTVPVLRRKGILDIPNRRSSHEVPTPRGGGIGILCGLAAGLLLVATVIASPVPIGLLAALALMAVIGGCEDFSKGLPVVVRLAVQCLAAGLVVGWHGGLASLPLPAPADPELVWLGGRLGMVLAVVWIVGVTNIFNFLDGIDGYAAVQAVVAGLGLAALQLSPLSAGCGLALAGACLGFLPANWHRARVFMGDVGSLPLGFCLAALPFTLPYRDRDEAVFAVALLLWFFLSDGVFTMARRALRHERLWTAHRSHLYQRLAGTGLGHDRVVIAVGMAAAVVAAAVVLACKLASPAARWLALGLAVAAFVGYERVVWYRESRASAGGDA